MLTTMSSQQRHVTLIGAFFIFLFFVSYHQYTTTSKARNDASYSTASLTEEQQQGAIYSLTPSDLSFPVLVDQIQPVKQPQPCDAGDIPWLASDRQHWDGWQTKSFFLQPDGNFTLNAVHVEEGTGLCVVVLLGPVPAASKIKVEPHYAPPDIITMTAIGSNYHIPITLHQYPKQANAYYANVYFRHPDAYVLKSSTEYRSYFWETPIHHRYQPFYFDSSNMAIVTSSSSSNDHQLSSCDPQQPLQGSWRNDTDRYEFIPDHCQWTTPRLNLGASRPLDCLQHKTVHIWGDANVRRNMKALASPSWCDMQRDSEALCICNDDNEDPAHTLYPWAADHNIPLHLGQDTTVHYNSLSTITLEDWRPEIQQRVQTQLAPADVVIVSVGNDDVALSRMKPHQFAQSLTDLLHHLQHTVYTHQNIIVRTPQFFGAGQHYSTYWNAGRSRAFANVVRSAVNSGPRLFLWDTHQLGSEHNTCRYQGTTYTKRNVIDVENQLLLDLLCGHPS